MNLGQRIAFFRKKSGLNQREFADEMRTTEATINRWEQNKSIPRPKAKAAMSEFFGVAVDELDEAQSAVKINEVCLLRATVSSWIRDRHHSGCSLTLVTRTGHFNMVIARKADERTELDILTGAFELKDILPLIRGGIITTFCEPGVTMFNRLRAMQLRDSEIFDLLRTAERFESNEIFSRLLDDGLVENAREAILIEKWRQLSPAQQRALEVTIDIKLQPEESNDEELQNLIKRANRLDSSTVDISEA